MVRDRSWVAFWLTVFLCVVGQVRYVVNLTVVRPASTGHLTAFGCSDIGDVVPAVSTMNCSAGTTVAHQSFVAIESAEPLCDAATQLVIDLVGAVPHADTWAMTDVGRGVRWHPPAPGSLP